jgi:hypothetical protein
MSASVRNLKQKRHQVVGNKYQNVSISKLIFFDVVIEVEINSQIRGGSCRLNRVEVPFRHRRVGSARRHAGYARRPEGYTRRPAGKQENVNDIIQKRRGRILQLSLAYRKEEARSCGYIIM